MKKIIAFSLLVLLAFGANVFAAELATNTPTTQGAAVFGAPDATVAATMANRLVSLSKGVMGLVNFVADTTNKTSVGYVIACLHTSGTKLSGTSNDSTKIYWKQTASTASADFKSAAGTNSVGSDNFAAGLGWTEY